MKIVAPSFPKRCCCFVVVVVVVGSCSRSRNDPPARFCLLSLAHAARLRTALTGELPIARTFDFSRQLPPSHCHPPAPSIFSDPPFDLISSPVDGNRKATEWEWEETWREELQL